MTFHKKVVDLITTLKANKDLHNKFGGYKYRSTETILESVKPLLSKHSLRLTISDEIQQIGDRYYVHAVATLSDGNDSISSGAYAREQSEKKGMDQAQLTGACSSYARKYALCGLLCIDDGQDADSHDNRSTAVPATKGGITADAQTQIRSRLFKKGFSSEAALKKRLGFWPPKSDAEWKLADKLSKEKS